MALPTQPAHEGDLTFASDTPFRLESGGSLQPVTLRYSVYGELNRERSNAVLACHALSGSSRVADWWPGLFGPAGLWDLSRTCVIGINLLGSCYGSSGPISIDRATGTRYGARFPLVTIGDMVRAQVGVLDHLEIPRWQTVIGGSIGGMQAVQWAIEYPDRVGRVIAIGAAPLTAMALAWNHLQRQAIRLDPLWKNGNYEPLEQPAGGLALARALAMCSYKSPELFTERFARKPNRNGEEPSRSLAGRFDVAGYLDYQGEKFTARFDANSYLVISKAMDLFDPSRTYGSDGAAFGRIRAPVVLVAISSDWLFPAAEVHAWSQRMRLAGVDSKCLELASSHGHDGFLADMPALVALLRDSC